MAELALAIVPIFFGAVRGFTILQDKIHLLRHYRKEVGWLRTRVDVQARCFRGEVHHVVIDTLDTPTAQSLITDDSHTYWKSQDLEAHLVRHMGELHAEFIRAIEEVKAGLTHIEAKLSVFAQPDVNSPLFKATKDKFRLAFRKEEYKDDINNLKEWIAELKRIRKLARAMQKSSASRSKEVKKEKEVAGTEDQTEPEFAAVKEYGRMKHLSTVCQSALQQWTCKNQSHLHHAGRLFLRHTSQRHIVLLIESSGRNGAATLSNRLLFGVQSEPLGLLTPESIGHTSFEDFDGPLPKRQKTSVRGHSPAHSQGRRESEKSLPEDMVTLCQQLETCSIAPHPRPVVHIDVRMRERFEFDPKPSEARLIEGWESHQAATLSQLFGCRPHDAMLNRERIQLALVVVKGTLMNFSTRGWPQGCLLESIGFLHRTEGDIDASAILNTLNIPVSIGSRDVNDTDMESGSLMSDDELQFMYGIRNQVLYRVGVALLSIGLWTAVDWRDVAGVRRKAASLDSLGKRFRDAVERLLYSNFGVDTTNLGDEHLQVEILRAVVGPLERRAESRRR